MNGPAIEHYFENFVITQLVRNYAYSPNNATLSYYRDQNEKEIDLIIQENRTMHPFEIKKSANPDYRAIKKFAVLDNAVLERGTGGIICMVQDVLPIDNTNCLIPCNVL